MKDKNLTPLNEEKLNALLVSVKVQQDSDEEVKSSLRELERLVNTLGLQVVATETQRMPKTTGPTVLGEGKLEELKRYTSDAQNSADVVVFDCDLTPSQIRNVENVLGVQVMDRTGVIIEIFSRHAKTREARVQVEIARLNYLAPRLREKKQVGDRQHYSGRGAGETQLELDRRRIRDLKAELKKELVQVQKEQDGRRSQRREEISVALVGYTNAGKSSLMRALTGSQVLVQDKLFATLDTTVRALEPATQPKILISDTVGFISKLPHDLVASFHSTLEEARHASLLLFVVDAADLAFRSQLAVVKEVLGEIGADKLPQLLVLNKSDCLNTEESEKLKAEFPKSIMISTRNKEDVKLLHQWIEGFFDKSMVEAKISVPYNASGIIGEIHARTKVLSEQCDNDGTHFTVRSFSVEIERLKKMIKG